MTPLKKLVSIASRPLIGAPPTLTREYPRSSELLRLLRARNGFYVFESALHVFPAGQQESVMDLEQWNAPALWRASYGDLVRADCVFFAEDVFGMQFGLVPEGVVVFDPESSEAKPVAASLDAWVAELLREYRVITGWPLAHAWQEQHGALPAGKRLVPKTPFVLGGAFDLENLYLADAVEAMRARASIARQIAHLPDGAQIQLKIGD